MVGGDGAAHVGNSQDLISLDTFAILEQQRRIIQTVGVPSGGGLVEIPEGLREVVIGRPVRQREGQAV